MMGKNCHLVIYPINKKRELNFVCILRHKNKDPDNIKELLDKVIKENPYLEKDFDEDLKSWPLYFTPQIIPSNNSKVFYIGDAFNGFLPTLAQGAGQSIESAYELFNLLKDEKVEIQNIYFKERSKRIKKVRRRSNLNFFVFHFSSSIMQKIRNFFINGDQKSISGFASPYTKMFGQVLGGYYMAKASIVAKHKFQETDEEFYKDKITLSKFYIEQLLPLAETNMPPIDCDIEDLFLIGSKDF